ncbi:MAG: factor-independent urate hydroxylase, partial [Thermoanaerobaculia bacterium]
MLAQNNYGKSGIRLVKIHRRGENHDVTDLTVAVRFEGEFAAAHASGDNADVLPTDTMKNTVYALAKSHSLHDIESFGLDLAQHFLSRNPGVSRVSITLVEHPWERLTVAERPHPSAFRRSGEETRFACVTRTHSGATVEAGLDGLVILKSAQSAFSGFRRDEFTTLQETRDRIFATSVSARWRYGGTDLPFKVVGRTVRQTLIETFAEHQSESVQHTLHAMGEAVLERHAEVDEIRLSL